MWSGTCPDVGPFMISNSTPPSTADSLELRPGASQWNMMEHDGTLNMILFKNKLSEEM